MFEPPKLRLALGLGDQALEQRLRPAFDATDDMVVVAQCLAADQLLRALDAREIDAMVVACNLHRLTDAVLLQLERPGVPMVLLATDPRAERWRTRRDPTLALDADASAIRLALLAARRGERRPERPRASPDQVQLKPADRPDAPAAHVVAVSGGFGSPGRSTVAINLAASLGAVAPTVLVELDLCTTSFVAYLDRDPSRNICTLAHTVRDDPRAWHMALRDEIQPLSHRGSAASVLCGPPKREMRASLIPSLVEQLIAELSLEYRWVVLDVGPELVGLDTAGAVHRAALAAAQQLLLVVRADLVGLWHGRTALDLLERQLGVERSSVEIVLNGFDARHHHGRAEVEWHLGAPVAAVVPFDHAATQRAIAAQQPLVHASSGRASRGLIELAEHLHHRTLGAPRTSDATPGERAWWRRLFGRRQAVRTVRRPREIPRENGSTAPAAAAPGGHGAAWS